MDPVFAILVRILFALLFISAAVSKFDTPRFRAILDAYRLLPPRLAAFTARWLPGLELTMGLAWAAGVFPAVVVIASETLLAIYGLAIAINLLRGNSNIDCGCGFGSSGQQLSWGLVLRNLILIAIAGSGLLATTQRSLVLVDYFTVVTAVLAALLLYGACRQLLANSQAMVIWLVIDSRSAR